MAYNATYPSSGAVKYAPIIFSSKVMRLYTESTVMNEICNTDYEGEISGKGDTVYVRVAPTPVAGDVSEYSVGTPIVYTRPTENARSLLIDQAYYKAFTVDEVDKMQSDLGLMELFAERAALSLKLDTDRRILAYVPGQVHASNKGVTAGKISGGYNLGAAGAPITVTKDNAIELIADLGTVLDEANIPDENRWIVIPAWFANLLKKGDLKRVDITGDDTGVIRTGLIGQIDRFKVYQSNQVYHVTENITGDTVETFSVLAGVKDAITFASQVNKTETLPDPDQFGERWRTLLLYGRKVIMPEACALLLCTKNTYTP
jgi:hypothetical protein